MSIKIALTIGFMVLGAMTLQAQQAMLNYTRAVAQLHNLSDGMDKSQKRGAILADFYYARIDEAGKEKAMTETGDILRQYIDYDFYAVLGFMMKTARTREDMKAFSDRYMQKKEKDMIVQLANAIASGSLNEKNYPTNVPAPGKGIKGSWVLVMDKQRVSSPVATTTANDSGKAELDKGHIAYRAKNYSEALNWYKKAADKGYAAAMFNIGVMHYHAQGVTQNYAEAINWFKKAAEKDDVKAMNNLGVMYYNAQGVPQNHTEAFSWYKKAAEKGHTDAKHSVGFLYVNGIGVQQNYPEARKWLKEAANEGHILSPEILWEIDRTTYSFLLMSSNQLDKWEGSNGKYGMEGVIPAKYESGALFSEDKNFMVAPAKLNSKWGFIDLKDKVVIPFIYEEAHFISFVEGFAAVKQNGKWGFIDKTGKVVVPFLYDKIELGHFINGYAKVIKNGKTIFVDKQGKEVK